MKMEMEMIKKHNTIKTIVDSIMADKNFYKVCEEGFKDIYEDGVIDEKDIPMIINLLLTAYVTHSKIKITKKHKKQVLILLVHTLIETFQVNNTINTDIIMLLIEPQIDLILLNIDLPKCKWCSSRPIDEGKVINNIKLNRLNNIKHDTLEEVVKEEVVKEELLPETTSLKLEEVVKEEVVKEELLPETTSLKLEEVVKEELLPETTSLKLEEASNNDTSEKMKDLK